MSTTTNRPAASELEAALAGFHGSEDYHQHGLRRDLFMTDGVFYLAEKAGAHWLTDIVASYQGYPHIRREEFQTWTLTKLPEGSKNMARVRATDGNGKNLCQQLIPYTDFPLDEITLYCEAGSLDGRTPARILMLPGER